jgi:cation transport regulator ChaC
MLYFAYGSNMLLSRLADRIADPKIVGTARLCMHTLRFHKPGMDGSGKADAFYTGNRKDFVYGIVFEIPNDQITILDYFEGEGVHYERVRRTVTMNDGTKKRVWVYLALIVSDKILKPTIGYKNKVLYGAIDGKFPRDYIEKIRKLDTHSVYA